MGQGEGKGVKFLAHSDMEGRRDAVQLMGNGDYLYVGHMWSGGTSIIDVSDPKNSKIAAYIPSPNKNSWNTNIQVADDLLIVADELVLFGGNTDASWTSALKFYDVSDPRNPRLLTTIPNSGRGPHRMWYTGGKYAFLTTIPEGEGFERCILSVFDVSNPVKPIEVSRWWLQGQGPGETPLWEPGAVCWCHGCVVADNYAYCGWWDAGMIILDVSDASKPKFVSRLDYSPPFGGSTHTCVPLPKRDLVIIADESIADNCEEGQKMIWVVDVRDKTNPIPISLFPIPEGNFRQPGARFGPHNLHENRPGAFQSDTIIFNAYFRAGLRIFDITNQYRPEEIGYYMPLDPEVMMDPRPGKAKAPSSQDVYVDKNGIIYLTDYNCGLSILEFQG